MDNSSQTSAKQKPIKKLLLSFVIIGLFLSVTFITGIFLLPKFVSTNSFKEYVENFSTKFLTRGVRIERLFWSWSDGIILENILVEDDPSFSEQPVFLIKNAHIRPGIRELLQRRLALDVMIEGIHFTYIRDKKGQPNLETLFLPSKTVSDKKEKIKKPSPSKKSSEDNSISVPLDISTKIHLDGISLTADDQMSERKLEMGNGSIHLDIPSLYHHPVKLTVNAGVRIDRGTPLSLRVALSVKNKGDIPKEIRPENLEIGIDGVLPGVEFKAEGDLGEKGLRSGVNVSLGAILETAKPFLPEDFQDSAVDGRLEFDLAAKRDSKKRILFDTGIRAVKVKASGKFLKNKQVGPVDLSMINNGFIDIENNMLKIDDGRIQLLKEGLVEWRAEVSELTSGKPKADAVISHAYVNLEEILKLVNVFLPPDLPVTFQKGSGGGAPNIKIGTILFSGGPGADKNQLNIKSLAIDLPGLYIKHKENVLSMHDMVFAIERMETDFRDIFPVTVRMRTGLTAGDVNIPGQINVNGLTKVFDAECRIQSGGNAELMLKEFSVHAPSILLANKSIGGFNTDAGITFKPCRIIFRKDQESRLDIEDYGILLNIGKFIKAEMNGAIRDTAKTKLQTRGDVYVTLGEIPEELLGDYKDRVNMSGEVVFNWLFNGRLPDENEKKLLASFSGINTGEALSFIEHAGIRFSINEMKTHMNLDGGGIISAGSLTASPLISYEYSHKENTGKLLGNIVIKDIKRTPESGIAAPVSVNVAIKGGHNGLHRIRFNEKATLEPLSLEQAITLNLFGADKIIEERLQGKPQAWLMKTGGDLQALVRIKNMSETKMLKSNVDVSGEMAAGVKIGLLPGKMTDARIWVDATDIDLGMEGIAEINDFYGKLNIVKKYQIIAAKEEETDRQALKIEPLSSRVMENAFELIPKNIGPAGKSRWHHVQGKKRFHPERTVGFSSMNIKKGPVPLRVDTFKADINLEKGLPGIEYFQNDIFGGTVSGSIKISKAGEIYFLKADIDFTGIDFETILPEGKKSLPEEDTEVSGLFKLYLPITNDMDTFLAKTENHLMFTHIGSRALERLLYTIDPYESNEAVVSQRRLLQKGSPKWAELKIKDGNLSMRGELAIEGVDINFPSLERLNISNLPGMEKYAGRLSGLKPIVRILEIASANVIEVGEKELKAKNLE
jgi:hypothetical protein